jgi:hypothetical protein
LYEKIIFVATKEQAEEKRKTADEDKIILVAPPIPPQEPKVEPPRKIIRVVDGVRYEALPYTTICYDATEL